MPCPCFSEISENQGKMVTIFHVQKKKKVAIHVFIALGAGLYGDEIFKIWTHTPRRVPVCREILPPPSKFAMDPEFGELSLTIAAEPINDISIDDAIQQMITGRKTAAKRLFSKEWELFSR
jgi:hypothetical protein